MDHHGLIVLVIYDVTILVKEVFIFRSINDRGIRPDMLASVCKKHLHIKSTSVSQSQVHRNRTVVEADCIHGIVPD